MTASAVFERRQAGMARALAAESVLDLYDLVHFARVGRVTPATWMRIRGVAASSVTATFARARRFLADHGIELRLVRDERDEADTFGRTGGHAPGHFEFDRRKLAVFVDDHADEATEILEQYRAEKRLNYERVRPPWTDRSGGGERMHGDDDQAVEDIDEELEGETVDQEADPDEADNEGGIFGCERCEFTTMKRDELAEHRRACVSAETEPVDEAEERFECDECDFVGKSKDSLWGHRNKHRREERAREAEQRQREAEKRRLARERSKQQPAASATLAAAQPDAFTSLRAALDGLPKNARKPALELLLALEAS